MSGYGRLFHRCFMKCYDRIQNFGRKRVNCVYHPHDGQLCLENRMRIGLKDYLSLKNPLNPHSNSSPCITRLDALSANALV